MTKSLIDEQQIIVPNGSYVIAVSGGVDSIVLLDILAKKNGLNLIVAHFDHGIRHNSAEDAQFVNDVARKYGLKYITESGKLGENASEEQARNARYAFLSKVALSSNSRGIITAHHQDDAIETCFINLIRGTGRHGISALKNRPGLYRPFLNIRKDQIIAYARENKLKWREDETNNDIKYLRNKLRLKILPNMTEAQRQQIIKIIQRIDDLNQNIDQQLSNFLFKGLHKNKPIINRKWFCKLPSLLAEEVIYFLMKKYDLGEIDKKTIDRLAVQIKTLSAGKRIQFSGGEARLTKRSARFI